MKNIDSTKISKCIEKSLNFPKSNLKVRDTYKQPWASVETHSNQLLKKSASVCYTYQLNS